MPKWRNEYRRCDNCRCEYRPQREAQSYCNRDCRRAAAYARERFKAGTKGRRKRRLEASDKLPDTPLVAGSFRNGEFSSIKPGGYKGGITPALVQDRRWSHLYRIQWPDGLVSAPANLTRCKDAIRNWMAISLEKAA